MRISRGIVRTGTKGEKKKIEDETCHPTCKKHPPSNAEQSLFLEISGIRKL